MMILVVFSPKMFLSTYQYVAFLLLHTIYSVHSEELSEVVTEIIQTGVDDVDILLGDNLSKVETFEDIEINYTLSCNDSWRQVGSNDSNFPSIPGQMQVKLCINDSSIAKFPSLYPGDSPRNFYLLDCGNESSKVIRLVGGHLGITKMTVQVIYDGNNIKEIDDVEIRVKRKMTLFDELSFFILGPLILLNKCAFGAKIELNVLKQIFTQPLALSLCLFMQFIGMPLLALLYATLFKLSENLALALFVAATCPGGGGGYVISYLIGGDVTLAISASLLSTVVAMGAMPAVLGLYAHFSHIPDTIAIPYVKIILILCAIAIPISAGMIINKKWPKFAKKLVKIIQPLSLFLIFCGFLFLAVSSRYIIHGPVIGWALAVSLPMSGFILAIIFSRCVGLDWPFAKAISLESGMKNTVLGIAVIELTYPQPEADLSSILIIMVTLGHTSLAMLWYFGYLIRERCCKSQEKVIKFTKLEDLDDEAEDDESLEFVALTSS